MDNAFSSLAIETVYNVLLYASYSDIINFCSTDKLSRSICDDSRFWLSKLDYDFTVLGINGNPVIPSKYITQYGGGGDERMQDTYLRWMGKPDPIRYHSILRENLDIAAYLLDSRMYDIKIIKNLVYYALELTVDILDILIKLDSYGYVFDVDTMDQAIHYGWINIMDWLESKGIKTRENIYIGPIRNEIATYEWLERRNVPIEASAISRGVHFSKLHILNWLHTKGILPSEMDALYAVWQKHMDVAEWLDQRGIHPSPSIIEDAVQYNEHQVLDWLYDHSQLPYQNVINAIITHDVPYVFGWLKEKHIHLDYQQAANLAAISQSMNVLVYLHRKGYNPDQGTVNTLATMQTMHSIPVLDLCLTYGIQPDQDTINKIFLEKMIIPMSWCLTNRLHPDQNIINEIARSGDTQSIQYFARYGLYPTQSVNRGNRESGWFESMYQYMNPFL